MSRIGKQSIRVTEGVVVTIGAGNTVQVSGPKGTLHLQVDPSITVSQQNGQVRVQRSTDQKRHRAMHGLYRALLQNMVTGVTQGYKKEMEIIGVGTRAEVKGGRA